MLARGFSVSVRFTDETVGAGDRPEARTGVVLAQVTFDEQKGPKIGEVGTAYLEIREGESLLAFVPMSASQHPRTGNISRLQFSAREDLLMKMSIVLMPRGQGNALGYAIPIKEFYQASGAPARSNNGMHPTADTNNFMLRGRLGAAGDAGR